MMKILKKVRDKIYPEEAEVKETLKKTGTRQKKIDDILDNYEKATLNGEELFCTLYKRPKRSGNHA